MTTTLVTFDMWGQRCTTMFDSVAEALAWIEVCYDKGFMKPIALRGGVDEGEVLYNGEQLIEMFGEK